MVEHVAAGGRGATRYRTGIGGSWWLCLVVVSVGLGFVGRSAAGFWSPFLWSVVGFVVGSLAALAFAAGRVPARSEAEARGGLGAGTAAAGRRPDAQDAPDAGDGDAR